MPSQTPGTSAYNWDYKRHESIPDQALPDVDGIVHLMGKSLGKGGVLGKLLPLFRMGLGGSIGDGYRGFSSR
ncbi:MAG TPA: hypothetical protein PKG49_03235 [Nitrosomonas mobilis]|nr:hypothetical protein [Nitrosomonas mobilis]